MTLNCVAALTGFFFFIERSSSLLSSEVDEEDVPESESSSDELEESVLFCPLFGGAALSADAFNEPMFTEKKTKKKNLNFIRFKCNVIL